MARENGSVALALVRSHRKRENVKVEPEQEKERENENRWNTDTTQEKIKNRGKEHVRIIFAAISMTDWYLCL